mmetsp:Transcript_5475/g.12487  ORF Transcript_5475/g.12487 Transcript_5475/m.12487 type:complete len:179 (-) Transcript_5475:3880-4416(-)
MFLTVTDCPLLSMEEIRLIEQLQGKVRVRGTVLEYLPIDLTVAFVDDHNESQGGVPTHCDDGRQHKKLKSAKSANLYDAIVSLVLEDAGGDRMNVELGDADVWAQLFKDLPSKKITGEVSELAVFLRRFLDAITGQSIEVAIEVRARLFARILTSVTNVLTSVALSRWSTLVLELYLA